MRTPDVFLKELENLLSESFTNAIVWEQRDEDLIGKYLYIKYDGRDVGIFMGYQMGKSSSIRGGITFFFTHPAATPDETKELTRVFHKLLIRLNLRLRENPYKVVGGRSPAIIRMKYFSEANFSADMARTFFNESIIAIRNCEPLYKAASH